MYRTGMVLRMYRVMFGSSCFVFYILQRWFRNVKVFYRETSKPQPPPPPPPPQKNIWCFLCKKSICEASLRGKFVILNLKKHFFVSFWNRNSVHFNYISLYIFQLKLTENLAKYSQVAKLKRNSCEKWF
jgi:hypothetical protein